MCRIHTTDQPPHRVLESQQQPTQPTASTECHHQHIWQSTYDTTRSAGRWCRQQWQVGKLRLNYLCTFGGCSKYFKCYFPTFFNLCSVQFGFICLVFNFYSHVQVAIFVLMKYSLFQFHCAQMTPIVLASSCEALWCSSCAVSHKPHLSHALWLHCGVHGTRAWLPLFPNSADKSHIFLARRIMLPFTPSIYPLGEQNLMFLYVDVFIYILLFLINSL